jgi:pyruvate formate lyase activating enzyme
MGAVTFHNDVPYIELHDCNLCMDCVKACPEGALEIAGKTMTLGDVVEEACRDELFYTNSGGGVTLSGGEPLYQPEFAYNFLRECKERSISTALDTSGYGQWEILRRILQYTDLVLFDLKHLDAEMHLEGTHVRNDLILENLRKTIDSREARVWIRIPVVPGYNDSDSYVKELALVVRQMPAEKVSLLGYHEWGRSKYEALGRDYPYAQAHIIPKERLEQLKAIMEAEGIKVTIDH